MLLRQRYHVLACSIMWYFSLLTTCAKANILLNRQQMPFQSCVWLETLRAMLEVAFSSKCSSSFLTCKKFVWTSIYLEWSRIYSLGLMIVNCGILTREYDENLLRRICELFYEDEVSNLPSPPDVSNYLMSEVCQ